MHIPLELSYAKQSFFLKIDANLATCVTVFSYYYIHEIVYCPEFAPN